MAESQYYPSTSPGAVLVNGVEVENQDLALVGQVAGLADDRVLAELFRLMPTDGTTIAKAIFPSGYFPNAAITPSIQASIPTVQPTGSANASILVNPFRVVLGSRTALGANSLQNWHDNRSAVFVNASTTLSQSVTFAANASGNPRWDLVYVALSVDVQTNQVQRRVKNASTSNVTVQTIYQYLAQGAAIQTVQGTPGATPARPALPADSGGVYNVPLGYVRIPNGFTALSTVLARDIIDAAPIVPISRTTGAATLRPANGNNDGAATYATNFPWVAGSSGARPSVWLPSSMIGAEQLVAVFDLTSITEANWSHPPNSIVDSSVDWRGRAFKVFWQAGSGKLCTDPTAVGGTQTTPYANLRPASPQVFLSNSMTLDGALSAGNASVLFLQHADDTADIASGAAFGLYVDHTTGALKIGAGGTSPACTLFVWLEATGQYQNY